MHVPDGEGLEDHLEVSERIGSSLQQRFRPPNALPRPGKHYIGPKFVQSRQEYLQLKLDQKHRKSAKLPWHHTFDSLRKTEKVKKKLEKKVEEKIEEKKLKKK